MMLEHPQLPEPLPRWLIVPLGTGIVLVLLGLAMPWLYPQEKLWTNDDAKKHAELATQAHAAHHAAAHAQSNKRPTAKEDAAKARWYREQYDQSATRLRNVREGGDRYGQWLLIAGGTLIAGGVGAAWWISRE